MRAPIALAALVIVVLLVLPACGKKGDPVPPQIAIRDAVSHVELTQSKDEVILAWVTREERSEGKKFRIYRRELNSTECPGCEQKYALIADLPAAESGAGDRYGYRDSTVKPDRVYGYRIAVCSNSGLCSAPSAEVLIHYGSEGTGP